MTTVRETNGRREPLGLAVLGCGYWGTNYLRLIDQVPGARLVAVCDHRRELLDAVRDRFPSTRLTTRLAELVEDLEVEAVVVATAARDHHGTALACLRAGRHVLVEKPLTTRREHADELLAVSDALGLTLMVGHTFLFNPGLQLVREYVVRRQLGPVYYVHARRTALGPIRDDVNAAWDLASHDVAIFSYLLGAQPEWVSAVGAGVLGAPNQDVAFVSLGYPGGVIGHVHVSWVEAQKIREVVVVGGERRIVFNDVDPLERVRVFEKGVVRSSGAGAAPGSRFELHDGPIVSPVVEPSEPLGNQLMHFLSCIATGRRPRTDGHLGRAVVHVMEAIDQSMARRGAPVVVASASANGAPADRDRWLLVADHAMRRRRRVHPLR